MARVAAGALDDRALSLLRSSSVTVLATLREPAAAVTTTGATGVAAVVFPADAASEAVRAVAEHMIKLTAAVEATASTGSQIDRVSVVAEVAAEAKALALRAESTDRDLRVVGRKVEEAVGQVESWQQRRTEAPEFLAEEAAREEAWSKANREANTAALREMRSLLPEAVWDMKAGDIQAAAAAAATTIVSGENDESGAEGMFYPSDLCVRLRECRPLHWLVSSPEDIASANFLAGEGAPAFTQLEGMDLTEMRAVWCVLPKEFARDADGKKAEWRARFRVQLEAMARQQDRAVISAG